MPAELETPTENNKMSTESMIPSQTRRPMDKLPKESDMGRRLRYAKQFGIVLVAAIVSVGSGMIQLWPNVLAGHYAQRNTTIISGYEIQLAPWQLDLAGSIAHVGSMVGFLVAGYLVSRVGRKWSLVITAFPGILGSTLITVAINTHMIIIGRFMEGITNGMMNVAVFIYASETADTSIRGSISMLCFLMVQSGGIFTISLGTTLTWYYMSLICCCVLLLHCLLATPLLNESPSFLAINHRDEEALRVLRSLRGPDFDIHEELNYLQKQTKRGGNSQGYRDLLKMEHLKKIGIMSVIFFIHNFCGTQVLRVNATRLLRAFGTQLDEKVMTILIIGTLLAANTFMTTILDWYGRRRFIITSLVILTGSYTALGAYIHIMENNPSLIFGEASVLLESSYNSSNTVNHLSKAEDVNTAILSSNITLINMDSTMTAQLNDSSEVTSINDWLPLLILTSAAVGHGIGIGPLVFVLSPEMFPTSVRSQGTSICTTIGSLWTFAVLQLYSLMQESLTQAGLYWLFAIVSGLGAIFVIIFLKETSGSRVG